MKKLSRREFIKSTGLLACSSSLCLSAKASASGMLFNDNLKIKKPNVVFIFSDDQGLSEVGCYGGDVVTPNIDSLAKDGMKFDRFYVSSAVCNPSRYNVLTGRYASRSQIMQKKYPPPGPMNIGWEPSVYADATTVSHLFKEKGYRTGMVGEWMQGWYGKMQKLGDVDPEDPKVKEIIKSNYKKLVKSIKDCGFDYVSSAYYGNVGWWWSDRKEILPTKLRHHNQDWITQGAWDFIEDSKDGPFFLYMPTTLTHTPEPIHSVKADPRITSAGMLKKAPDVQPSRESILKRIKKAGVDEKYIGATWLDDGVGAVLKKLKELDLEEDTIVIFASDNGKKAKFTCYDAGTRMPFLVRWPGKIKKGSVNNCLASNVDIPATILDICGIDAPRNYLIDGRSIKSSLLGDNVEQRKSLYLEITTERAVVTNDNFKYIAVRYPPDIQEQVNNGKKYSHWCQPLKKSTHTYGVEDEYPGYFDQDQLYDLENDPEEQNNLARKKKYQNKLKKMKKVLKEYCDELPNSFGEFTPLRTGKHLHLYENFRRINE